MKPEIKLKIKEAENCMDPPSNKERFLVMLASMADEIIAPKN